MMLDAWAIRWGVSADALADLRCRFTAPVTDPTFTPTIPRSEAANSSIVRLEASRLGGRLFRNNVGACMTDTGFVRYGLCNDSAALNKQVKSSDLIGLRPVVVQPSMVGTTIGQFVGREIKRTGWVYRGTPEEAAQLKFLEIIVGLGGDACFCVGEGTL